MLRVRIVSIASFSMLANVALIYATSDEKDTVSIDGLYCRTVVIHSDGLFAVTAWLTLLPLDPERRATRRVSGTSRGLELDRCPIAFPDNDKFPFEGISVFRGNCRCTPHAFDHPFALQNPLQIGDFSIVWSQ